MEYLWADGKKIKKPIHVSAPEYAGILSIVPFWKFSTAKVVTTCSRLCPRLDSRTAWRRSSLPDTARWVVLFSIGSDFSCFRCSLAKELSVLGEIDIQEDVQNLCTHLHLSSRSSEIRCKVCAKLLQPFRPFHERVRPCWNQRTGTTSSFHWCLGCQQEATESLSLVSSSSDLLTPDFHIQMPSHTLT